MSCEDICLKLSPVMQKERWKLYEEFNIVIDADINIDKWKSINFNSTRKEDGYIVISIPKGFQTDLGSIPRPLWWFCSPSEIAHAAVVHDAMYAHLHRYNEKSPVLRKEADDTFYVILGMQCITGYRRFLIWLAVRAFGWLYI